ncbi:RNA 2',3'-cyclic phosphodiesterase [Roseiconus nitratireducens]|uniref:RNA 2',3'-cyclic phosphodiesterase n=1 Tax=Roseiconus nitratireducens TaxID=2605748 RepID=A0A5M6DAH2_9BACT|nr:RNA 2',3'-cyclic phosphodiesterase [Roseiconus nitratireducens]KAA5544564.1 RNA 2',3'-cyclic phosphodiesterase [Roseiconus nitratireducens]
MQTIRSFIAIPITAEISGQAARMIKRLKPLDNAFKWVPLDNLHLTLKFLGEVDNTEIPAVCKTVRKVTSTIPPFELSFAGAGGFPNLQRTRVLYAGVEDPSGNLVRLVEGLERQLAELGFKPEPRDYTPHLTLGRSRGRSHHPEPELVAAVEGMGDQVLGEMVVEEVLLMASFLDKAGPTYQTMDTIELADS